MGATNICVCFIMALVAINVILAEEDKYTRYPSGRFPPFYAYRDGEAPNDTEGRAALAEHAEEEHQDRLFFGLGPRLVTCNYTSQAGSTCPNCRQALRCLSSGVGILRTCRGFLPYCNNGRCSFIAGSACTNSTG